MFEGKPLTRRAFLKGGALFLGGAAIPSALSSSDSREQVRFGLITDIHYADANSRGTRAYRDSFLKMRQAVTSFVENKVHVAIEMGDLIDSPSRTTKQIDLQNLNVINNEFRRFGHNRHYVLGNHCLTSLSKKEFLGAVNRFWGHYAFDQNGWHVVILDGCNRRDGAPYDSGQFDWRESNIPDRQIEWLKWDLRRTNLPTIVLTHQRIDGDAPNPYCVASADKVRAVLESSKDVVAVFQGHSHRNDYKSINGIHYVTLQAMVEGCGLENNGWSIVRGYSDGSLKVDGYASHQENRVVGKRLDLNKPLVSLLNPFSWA